MNPAKYTTRVFFSFHVPDAIGSRLLSRVRELPVEFYPKENLHVTLHFVGEVNEAVIRKISGIAKQIASRYGVIDFVPSHFSIEEERLRLGVEPTPELRRLFRDLTSELAKLNIGKEASRSYAPHITLGRPVGEIAIDPEAFHASDYSFRLQEFSLYASEPGEHGMGQYTPLATFSLSAKNTAHNQTFTKIVLPTRSQPDTLVAIFILKKFGEEYFPGIKTAEVDFWQMIPEGETIDSLEAKGVIVIDLGGGKFDHHGLQEKVTASDLISRYLGVDEDPALAKLLEYARRDDFFGKGTVSNDPIDRAFGLSALIAALNKSLVKNPGRVIDIITPILIAHYNEEVRRTTELPKEFEELLGRGEVTVFDVKQRGKKLKVVMLTSESGSMTGFLRSQSGGKFDVVAQWLPSGHVNILTRPAKRIDLRSLAVVLRFEEARRAGFELSMDARELSRAGRINEAPEWYYDLATNSMQNGGLNPKEVSPTKISKQDLRNLLEVGLSEQVWSPRV